MSFVAETCPGCAGLGGDCVLCAGSGRWEVHGCPGRTLDASAAQIVELAVMATEGMGWPAPGGVLDQAAEFIAAWRLVAGQRASYQAMRKPDG